MKKRNHYSSFVKTVDFLGFRKEKDVNNNYPTYAILAASGPSFNFIPEKKVNVFGFDPFIHHEL